MNDRAFDIILFGATGFTGQLIARYLFEHAEEEGVTIALAGRNEKKGKELLDVFRENYPEAKNSEWITADINEPPSLDRMTAQGKVLMNAAGPFILYGLPVVEYCIKNKCHYLDITGEPEFVKTVEARYGNDALNNKVAVISACGFDSIPADLGTLLAVDALDDRSKVTVQCFIRTNAEFSGGTWNTAIHAISRKRKRAHPTGQNDREKSKSRKIPLKIHFSKLVNGWALPMPVVDPHIVKKSARSMPEKYGTSFAYAQFFSVKSFAKVLRIVIPIVLLFILVRISFIRKWLLNRNQPGTGPDADKRSRSKFEVRVFADSADQRSEVIVSGQDPGYNETSKMFSQAAFCLLNKINNGQLKAGVNTPAYTLGYDLIDRLKSQGIRMELISKN